jgi:hypothetical protein
MYPGIRVEESQGIENSVILFCNSLLSLQENKKTKKDTTEKQYANFFITTPRVMLMK